MSPVNMKLSRRDVLGAFGTAGVGLAVGFASSPASPTSAAAGTTTTTTGGTSSTSSCAVTAEQTAGPWPDRMGMSGNQAFFRQDITEGRSGLPLTLVLTIVNINKATDDAGRATFRTIYPGWYMGRSTHIHVRVFVNGAVIKTTQIAFPEDVTSSAYRTGVYAAKGQSTTSNSSDNVFSDGTSSEMTLSGDTTSGYTAALMVGVSV